MKRYPRHNLLHVLARIVAICAIALLSGAQTQGNPTDIPVVFTCPMHPDVQSSQPGRCPRCRMTLVAKLPDRIQYPLTLQLTPSQAKPGQPLQLAFTVRDPNTGAQVTEFQPVHEKLYHLFIVSQDLQYFLHDHPTKSSDASFRFTARLPKPGMYRLLSDFYPQGGTPQLIAKTIIVPGAPIAPKVELKSDLAPKDSGNMQVSVSTQPARPGAGKKTLLSFHLSPAEGLELYLGAWSHMLAVSDDLVDMIHDHPFYADGGPDMQFNIIFPRARVYRLWVQFQRKGVVNTAVFNIPVSN